MTIKNHTKVFKQLKNHPAKLEKFKKHNTPKKRTTGLNTRSCKRCGRHRGLIRSYQLLLCRQCFKEEARKLGFAKFD
jgi:small subunit ribosomal protein S14